MGYKYTDDDYCDIYENKICDNCGKCLEMEGIDTKAIKIEDISKNLEENSVLEEEFINDLKSNLTDDELHEINEENLDLKDIDGLKELGRFDVLTVNPPYKLNNSGIINPLDKLAIARHEIMCNLEDVIYAARVLLKDNGRIFIVHRPERLADIFTLMRKYKIEPKRVKMIHPKVNKAPNIVLVEGQRDGGAYLKWDEPLYVYNEDGKYTEDIDRIYGRK